MAVVSAAGVTMELAPSAGLVDHQPHALHTEDRHWPQTNCYIDLWVELLHSKGFEPLAGLGFTVTQDYEGDHFTFSKYQVEDLEVIYGLAVQEMAIYDRLETHLVEQVRRGQITLVEVDGWFLPDTRGLTYRNEHGKTTIGVHHIDPVARHLTYFHNSGFYTLEDENYDGIFASRPTQPNILPPYVEFVRSRAPALRGDALLAVSLDRFRLHLSRRPLLNPVSIWRQDFDAHLEMLFTRTPAFFHQYAFNLNRQLGMNWELLGSYLRWLGEQGQTGWDSIAADCTQMAEDAKTLQFRMARLISRKRHDPCTELLDQLESGWQRIVTNSEEQMS
jgi:Domain of unknown function (DUF1839)